MSYGLVATILLAVGFPLVGFGYVSPLVASAMGIVFCVPFSIWFWRYARSLWLGFGYYIDHSVRAGRARPTLGNQDDEADQLHLPANEAKFTCVCPFCHTKFEFAQVQRGAWGACAVCNEQILLLPVHNSIQHDDRDGPASLNERVDTPRADEAHSDPSAA